MTYEEFEKFVGKQYSIDIGDYDSTYLNLWPAKKIKDFKTDENPEDIVLFFEWTDSGASGGNCWGDSAVYFTNDHDAEKILSTVLDLLINELNPDISYMKYRNIAKAMNEYSYEDYEYYGNYNVKKGYHIGLKKLYDMIISK